MDDDQEILDEFVLESCELLEAAEADLMSLDPSHGLDSEAIHRVFRGVHSVKGAAGFFGLEVIAGLGHLLETVLMEIREGRMVPTRATVDVLLSSNDVLRALVDDVASSNEVDVSVQEAALNALLRGESAVAEPAPTSQPKSESKAQGTQQAFSFVLTPEIAAELRASREHLYRLTVPDQGGAFESTLAQAAALGRVLASDAGSGAIVVASVLRPDVAPVGFGLPPSAVAQEALSDVEHLDTHESTLESFERAAPSGDECATQVFDGLTSEARMPEPAEVAPVAGGEDAQQRRAPKAEDTVRIKIRQLGSLMAKAGEMVLARNRLIRWLGDHVGENQELNPILHDVSGITTALQEEIMQLRLQPVGALFSKFNRVVRDLSRQLDKDVVLVTEGEDVELDRTLLEGLSDPLTHLVRNALDHGVEAPADRELAGKPRRATIAIKAFHRNGRVNIEVSDDGGGIHVERVKNKAIERGIITREQAAELPEREVFNLLFAPGFSTASQVTSVSGRGVGMDVVRTNIQALGGEVVIDSVFGRGSTVTLAIPLTLAIVPALILQAASRVFVLPQVGLERVLRLSSSREGVQVEHIGHCNVIRYQDGLLPLVHLGEVLDLEQAQWHAEGRADRRVLVLRVGTERFGLVVDAIVDTEEIVVKPLSSYVRACPCFSGVTILGDGEVAMILDPPGIVGAAGLHLGDASGGRRFNAEREHVDTPEAVLVFSVGGEEKLGLPLAQIVRIERVERSAVRRITGEEFLTFGGRTLPLVRLENYLPIEPPMSEPEDYFVIIPRFGTPVGLVTHHVLDTRTEAIALDRKSIAPPGVRGSVRLGGDLVLLVDLWSLLEQARPSDFSSPADTHGDLEGQCALVVDGGEYSRTLHADFLRSTGMEVHEARSEAEAMELATSNVFDVVVVDLAHSEVDGISVVRRIRDLLQGRPFHGVGLGSAVGAERTNLLSGGLHDVVDRLDRNRLLESVYSALRQRRGAA